MIDAFPLFAVLVSVVGMFGILAAHRHPNVRESVTVVAALAKFGIVAAMVPGVLDGEIYEWSAGEFVAGIEFVLRADPLGTLFAFLASMLWIVTSFYSVGYMRGLEEHGQTRYFASFAMSLSATMGIAFAGNLVTIFVFYELLSIATYPLVAHDEDEAARRAGRKYLAYTMLGGGVLVLAGTVLVFWVAGTVSFAPGGIAELAAADPALARAAFALLAAGFGVKAGLMPLHSWLPDAMVAPTPVSGLLHAVAVVKSGVFGVARVVLHVFGPETVADLGVGVVLGAVAAITLLAASVIALRKDNLKRRLAYSTVSQLSYIVLGLSILHPTALTGGLLHVPAHAFMKLTLFFCAGIIHVETHTDDISDMAGIGKRMPVTMAAFAVAAAGMAGIPLVAGFVSKFYLLVGTVSTGQYVFTVALLVSGVLNIAYFWPVVYQAYFESEDAHDAKPLVDNPVGGAQRSTVARADGGHENEEDQEADDAGGPGEEDARSAERGPGDSGSDEHAPGDADSDDAGGGSDDTDGGSDDTDDGSDDAYSGSDDVGTVDPAEIGRPDFVGGSARRDYSEPAPLIDGEYAVDRHPSDHAVDEAAESEASARDDEEDHETDHRGAHPGDDPQLDHEPHDDHHQGPPPGGWERRGWLGQESTWFMLGPILAVMAGSVVVGLAPHAALFLRLIEVIVSDALATGVVV